jgi:hypothetical protein
MLQMAHPDYSVWPRSAAACMYQRNGRCLTADPPLHYAGLGAAAVEGDGGSLCFNQLQVGRIVFKRQRLGSCAGSRGAVVHSTAFSVCRSPRAPAAHTAAAYMQGAHGVIAVLRCGGARSPATAAAACLPARLLCLQVLGTHNSYHQAPPQELLAKFGGLTSGPLQAWQYNQPGLTAQLDTGA